MRVICQLFKSPNLFRIVVQATSAKILSSFMMKARQFIEKTLNFQQLFIACRDILPKLLFWMHDLEGVYTVIILLFDFTVSVDLLSTYLEFGGVVFEEALIHFRDVTTVTCIYAGLLFLLLLENDVLDTFFAFWIILKVIVIIRVLMELVFGATLYDTQLLDINVFYIFCNSLAFYLLFPFMSLKLSFFGYLVAQNGLEMKQWMNTWIRQYYCLVSQ